MKKSRIIIDTSVVLKWFLSENETEVDQARRIYNALKKGSIEVVAPAFLLVELSNILIKKKKVPGPLGVEALKKVRNSGIEFINFDLATATYLPKIMTKYAITAYDALFVDLAIKEKSLVLSADRILANIPEYGCSLGELTVNV